ncbi:MAG: hypothetical protein FWD38_00940 [Oscillospiraceae bacterium]|nr:hypothetical protein [Oscillospiraceae bacterium]
MSYLIIKELDVAKCNELVMSADSGDDILFLPECVQVHDGFYDEMLSCLYAAEKHAIVCGQEVENRDSLVRTAKKYLPKYSITINANAHCVLIKRSVIDKLGLFNTSFNCLQAALTDYLLRINRFGYSMVTSHHALFSYNDKRNDETNEADKELLIKKHYYWEETKRQFDLYGANPALTFYKLLDEEYYPKKRILFDCSTMPPYHCGTSEYQLSVYEAFYKLYKEKYNIFLLANTEADEYHGLTRRFERILYPETVTGVFHLGFAPNQLMFYENQVLLNKHCLRIVQTMFDIIMTRRFDDAFKTDMKKIVDLGIKLSDGIVFISTFTQDDFMARYIGEQFIRDKKYKMIYPATEFGAPEKTDYDLPFDSYYLIVGNMFEHKVLKETIEAVANTKNNFIVLGYGESEFIYPNVFGYMNGLIDDDFLRFLYSRCNAVIFPSLYEGFGFPVVMSLNHNKRVILNNNALNNELYQHFSEFKAYFSFYDRFEQIPEIIGELDSGNDSLNAKYEDSWERAAVELEIFLGEVLNIPFDATALNERWNIFNIIEVEKMFKYDDLMRKANDFTDTASEELEILYKQFGNYKLLPMLKFAVKKHIKHRYSRLFKRLKGE